MARPTRNIYYSFGLILLIALIFSLLRGNKELSAEALACLRQRESGRAYENPAVQNSWGYTGSYQLGVAAARDGGLCLQPVPSTGQAQHWEKCDFKGVVAVKYNIKNYRDFTVGPNAAAAQEEIIQRLYQKGRSINGCEAERQN